MDKISIYHDNKSEKLRFSYKIIPLQTKIEQKKFEVLAEKLSILENFPISGHLSELEIVSPIYDIDIDPWDLYETCYTSEMTNYDMTSRLKLFITGRS